MIWGVAPHSPTQCKNNPELVSGHCAEKKQRCLCADGVWNNSGLQIDLPSPVEKGKKKAEKKEDTRARQRKEKKRHPVKCRSKKEEKKEESPLKKKGGKGGREGEAVGLPGKKWDSTSK